MYPGRFLCLWLFSGALTPCGVSAPGRGPAPGTIWPPRSHRACRRLQELQAAGAPGFRWPVLSGLPVTDTLQSILVGAKFLSTAQGS